MEAARAGEVGRGFAVVAEEVRRLALRSKEAALRTESLIRESLKEAGHGEVTSARVSSKLGEIVASITRVTGIMTDIAAGAKDQASGIEQLSAAMGQMGSVTQQNVASSGQSSSAAAELSGQARELAAVVASFQLEDAEQEGHRHDPGAAPWSSGPVGAGGAHRAIRMN